MTSPAQAWARGRQIPAGGYRFVHAARMEWIKFRSLRPTFWALLLVVIAMISIGVVTMANTKVPSAERAAIFDPTNNVLAGMALGQLVIGVLGVLLVTGEYSSGSIMSTLAAIPRRPLVLAAKAAVFGAVALVVGEMVTFITFFAGMAALTPAAPHPALTQPGVLRALVLSGAYLALIGLIGVGLGAFTRHPASAIGVLVGITFVLPAILGSLTGVMIAKYLPTMIAANSLAVAKPVDEMLSPWAGLAMMSFYVVIVLGVGSWVMDRRDA